ncbi:MAG: hypothetical protein IJ727_11140 [Treponema sp.]|nr:hypothetical protein [Treponema sp.]
MKKTVVFFSALLVGGMMLTTLPSCASKSGISEDADSYDEYEATAIPVTQKKSPEKAKDSDPYSKAKVKSKNEGFFEKLFDFKKFEKYDSTNVFLKKGKKRVCTFVHKPDTDLGGFLVRYDTSSYACFLAQNERNALINAINQYFDDFDNKKLDKSMKKSERVYGQVGGYEEFGVTESMMTSYSKPKVYFGYKFLGKSPYFAIFVLRSPNLNEDLGSNRPPQSVDQKYYFTKAQAQKLADFLSDENIESLNHTEDQVSSEPDSYEEE